MTHLPTNHTKYNYDAYLDEAGCDAGAGGDHGLETAVVHHEVTHCKIQTSVRIHSLLRYTSALVYSNSSGGYLYGREEWLLRAAATAHKCLQQCSYEIIWTLLGIVACAYTIAINSVSSGTVYLKHS